MGVVAAWCSGRIRQSLNRGFVDGNKRVAYACLELFLALNGLDVAASNDDLERFICSSLKGGAFNEDVLTAWLRTNTAPRG